MKQQERWIPGIALRGLTVLPRMILHFDISRQKSVTAAERAMVSGQEIFLTAQIDPEVEDPGITDVHVMGTIARIKQLMKMPNQTIRIVVEGLCRAELLDQQEEETDFLNYQVQIADRYIDDAIEEEAMKQVLLDHVEAFAAAGGKPEKEITRSALERLRVVDMMDQIMGKLPVTQAARQEYLSMRDPEEQYMFLGTLLADEVKIQEMKAKFQNQVRSRIDKNQKEYILREQMRLIREELGEKEAEEGESYEDKVQELMASEEVKAKILKEIKRYRKLPMGSQEASVSQTYIETLLDMPWDKSTEENIDLAYAKEVLEADHYGLEKVKDRILDYLAVRKLSGKGEAPVLCLVGPPGTGKTSIAKSIAKAVNRKYVRICLGGVRDEAEIRGHRRTYVGSMPGRIAAGIKQAGVKNPLMLLDEIDKVSSDYKGDVSSALLEVLDTEQNVNFRDHYLEPTLDLSEVLFIATANTKDTIPGPLLDRMDVIEVTSYTENEKFHIADTYLVKKQMEKNGLKEEMLSINEEALREIIHSYTREAGVRNLERKIGEVCRKAAREILEKESKKVKVTKKNLHQYLGRPLPDRTKNQKEDQVGIATGLAWTSVGGCTLEIEINVLPGKGECKVTGKIGDVMQESAQAALTYIRSIAEEYGVDAEWFAKHDLHIHIPEGAVPKDGPSAGITLATALFSAVTGKKVRAEVAMTGEITLRGRVLPIGGLKEKTLAAKQAGIKTLVIPVGNQEDMEEISEEIKEGLRIVCADTMETVLNEAIVGRRRKRKQ